MDKVNRIKFLMERGKINMVVVVKDCEDYKLACKFYPRDYLISKCHWDEIEILDYSTPSICHLNKSGFLLGICSLKLPEEIITQYLEFAIKHKSWIN